MAKYIINVCENIMKNHCVQVILFSGNIQMPSLRNNFMFQNNFGNMEGYRLTDIVKPVNNKKQIL